MAIAQPLLKYGQLKTTTIMILSNKIHKIILNGMLQRRADSMQSKTAVSTNGVCFSGNDCLHLGQLASSSA